MTTGLSTMTATDTMLRDIHPEITLAETVDTITIAITGQEIP